MSEDSDSVSEEERSLFRPFTRESLAAIEARIAEEHAKQKKRAEGEVGTRPCFFFSSTFEEKWSAVIDSKGIFVGWPIIGIFFF